MLLLIPFVQAQGSGPSLSVIMTRYEPFPAEPDSYMNLWVKVQNQGSVPANNVTIELLDTYPFSLDPGEDRLYSFGEVLPSEPVLVEYRVRVDDNRDGDFGDGGAEDWTGWTGEASATDLEAWASEPTTDDFKFGITTATHTQNIYIDDLEMTPDKPTWGS